MAGRVNKVDIGVVPVTCYAGGCNGNAAFLFFWHIVHCRRPVMHFSHAVYLAGIEKDAFGKGSLAGINMGNNANVSDGIGTGH